MVGGREEAGGEAPARARRARGQTYVRIPLPRKLPTGYHRLTVVSQGETLESLLGARRAVRAFRHKAIGREWGLFCPIYAPCPADASRDWGCGGLSELGELARWGESLGGKVVATLPVLPAHFISPFDPSPYAPVSREFWNTLFADVWRAPEMASCPAAKRLIESPRVPRGGAARFGLKLIDYRRAAAPQRRVIELLAEQFFGWGARRARGSGSSLLRGRGPSSTRASGPRRSSRGAAWEEWPSRLSRGGLREGDFDRARTGTTCTGST